MYAVLIEIDDSCKDYHTKYTRSTPVVDSRGKVYDTVKEAMDDAKWYVRHIAMGCVSIRNSDGFKMADDGLSFVASNGSLMGKASVVKLERI